MKPQLDARRRLRMDATVCLRHAYRAFRRPACQGNLAATVAARDWGNLGGSRDRDRG